MRTRVSAGNEEEQNMTETIAYLREFHFASVVLRLALAMLLGGCIGLERERKRRPAGSALICWCVWARH